MKSIVLCRHAKSDWPTGVSDLHRPLLPRGEHDATALAALLASQEFMPDLLASSPARRAIETAEIFKQGLGYQPDLQIVPSVYHEGVAELINYLRNLDEQHETVMIVGHNPTMENALTHFLGASSAFELPTCAMACLEFKGRPWKDLAPHHLHLRWLLVPRLKRQEE